MPLQSFFSLICHQESARSFAFQGEHLPLCHRCAGVYVGVLAIALFFLLRRNRLGPLPLPLFVLNLFFLAAAAASGFHLVELGGEGRFVTGALLGAALASAGWPVFAGTVLATKLQAWRRSDRTVYLATLALASGLVFLTRCDSEAVGLAILVADVMGVVLAFVVPNSVAAWCIGRWVPALGRRHAVWALAAAFIALEFAILHLLSPAR